MTAKFGTSTKNTSQVLFDAIPHASWFWYTCRRCSNAATEHRSSRSLVVAAPHKHPPTHTLNSDAVAVRWDADVTWCQPKSKIGLFQRFSTAKIRQLSFFTLCRMEQLSQLTRREAEFTCVFWGSTLIFSWGPSKLFSRSSSICHQMSTFQGSVWLVNSR